MKLNSYGIRLCDDANCQEIATMTSIHSTKLAYCDTHIQKLIILAEAMGHPAPGQTVRNLTPAEIKPKE